jgi:hypothetical protein
VRVARSCLDTAMPSVRIAAFEGGIFFVKLTRVTLIKLAVLLLLSVCAIAQSGDADKNTKTTRKELTPERAIAAARKMRDRLNDPDSLRVVSFLYYESAPPDGHFLCVVFRAKNENGGLVLQSFANNAADTSPGGFSINSDPTHWQIVWSIGCKGEVVLDATDAVKAALKADREKE